MEVEVLKWISFGKHFDEISDILQVSHRAARQHAHRIMDKLGAATSAGAVAIALRKGVIK